MQPHQQRVIDEQTALDEKISKLGAFFDTDMFKGLPGDEQGRMARQFDAMKAYSNVLTERIAAF